MTKRRKKKQWGWGKSGKYKGIWCDSSWELAFLLYHLDKDLKIKRNGRGFSYTYYKKKHKYFPDFVVDGDYVEIKGRMDRKSASKIRQFPCALRIVGPAEIQKYLEYAIETYGKDFTNLYSKKRQKHRAK